MLCSCGHKSTQKLLPSVSGKAGEVLVVMEKSGWEGNLGVEVRELLASDCPYLAQREPLYSLVNITPSNFVTMFQVHRNIVKFEIDPQVQKEGVQYLSDVWARPQCVVAISAATEERAFELVKEKGPVIVSAIEQAERNRVIMNTLQYEEKSIAPKISELMGCTIHFPSGYKLMKKSADFVWVEDEKQYTTQGVFIYKYPVSGRGDDLELSSLVRQRNKILMENVPGMFENTYMTTSEFIPPTLEYVKYKNFDFAQLRGFWEVHNDYMGGPFVSHSMYSPDGKYVVTKEAFVYAPRFDKRQYLRQVESLLYSFEWDDEKN